MQRRWFGIAGAAVIAMAALITGCPGLWGGNDPGVAQAVTTRANLPHALAPAADGRVFYTEKNTGAIRVISDGVLLDEPFADVPVNYAGDRGLLGIALHPLFAQNGRVYVCYTRSDTGVDTNHPQAVVDQRIVYFEAAGDVARAGEVFVASLPVGAIARIGAYLTFGPDDRLYMTYGDHTDVDAALDRLSFFGKVLRFNDDGTIPPDNPFAGSAIYAEGLREPRGLAFDPDTGTGWIVERGPNGLSEFNLLQAGANYGWPAIAGFAGPADEDFLAENANYVDPVATRDLELVGAAFNPSTKYGPNVALQLYSGGPSGRVLRFELNTERTSITEGAIAVSGLPSPLTNVAFTPAGTLYIAAQSAVLRVVTPD
ncbi:MAG: PQQ-dependent sugar dehydrogenase [Planctomycetota bacterium]